jgi:hypothetical protein
LHTMQLAARTCDVCDVPVTQAWVECVADPTQAHNTIPALQVTRGVPRKRAHNIAKAGRMSRTQQGMVQRSHGGALNGIYLLESATAPAGCEQLHSSMCLAVGHGPLLLMLRTLLVISPTVPHDAASLTLYLAVPGPVRTAWHAC